MKENLGVIEYTHLDEFDGPEWNKYLGKVEESLVNTAVNILTLDPENDTETNVKILVSVLTKALLDSPWGLNEILQSVADCYVTKLTAMDVEAEITICLEGDCETWMIVGKDLSDIK